MLRPPLTTAAFPHTGGTPACLPAAGEPLAAGAGAPGAGQRARRGRLPGGCGEDSAALPRRAAHHAAPGGVWPGHGAQCCSSLLLQQGHCELVMAPLPCTSAVPLVPLQPAAAQCPSPAAQRATAGRNCPAHVIVPTAAQRCCCCMGGGPPLPSPPSRVTPSRRWSSLWRQARAVAAAPAPAPPSSSWCPPRASGWCSRSQSAQGGGPGRASAWAQLGRLMSPACISQGARARLLPPARRPVLYPTAPVQRDLEQALKCSADLVSIDGQAGCSWLEDETFESLTGDFLPDDTQMLAQAAEAVAQARPGAGGREGGRPGRCEQSELAARHTNSGLHSLASASPTQQGAAGSAWEAPKCVCPALQALPSGQWAPLPTQPPPPCTALPGAGHRGRVPCSAGQAGQRWAGQGPASTVALPRGERADGLQHRDAGEQRRRERGGGRGAGAGGAAAARLSPGRRQGESLNHLPRR